LGALQQRRYNGRTLRLLAVSTALPSCLRWVSWLGPEVFTDFLDGHVLLQSSKGEADYSAFGNIQARFAHQAGNACLLQEIEKVAVEIQSGWSGNLLPY
jgi:hypothetical protein